MRSKCNPLNKDPQARYLNVTRTTISCFSFPFCLGFRELWDLSSKPGSHAMAKPCGSLPRTAAPRAASAGVHGWHLRVQVHLVVSQHLGYLGGPYIGNLLYSGVFIYIYIYTHTYIRTMCLHTGYPIFEKKRHSAKIKHSLDRIGMKGSTPQSRAPRPLSRSRELIFHRRGLFQDPYVALIY